MESNHNSSSEELRNISSSKTPNTEINRFRLSNFPFSVKTFNFPPAQSDRWSLKSTFPNCGIWFENVTSYINLSLIWNETSHSNWFWFMNHLRRIVFKQINRPKWFHFASLKKKIFFWQSPDGFLYFTSQMISADRFDHFQEKLPRRRIVLLMEMEQKPNLDKKISNILNWEYSNCFSNSSKQPLEQFLKVRELKSNCVNGDKLKMERIFHNYHTIKKTKRSFLLLVK